MLWELIKEIKATGKNLKTVFISHSDPDFYFALDEIKKAFPNAEIVSTPQTAYLIEASKDDKLAVWSKQLGSDAPSSFIVPKGVTSLPDLEGNKLEIIQSKNDPAHSFVWISSIKTIVGGISIGIDAHLWMADTRNIHEIDLWIAQIDKMKSLAPTKVIPSHFSTLNESPEVLDFVKNYLLEYKSAAQNTKTGDELAAKLKAKYPLLLGEKELVMGAKIFKSEMAWDLKSPFPPIGHYVIADFGNKNKFKLHFITHKQLHLSNLDGKGMKELVNYTVEEIAPNVFMLYWNEPNSTKANVIHIENWNTKKVYTNIVNPDGTSNHLKGTLTIKN